MSSKEIISKLNSQSLNVIPLLPKSKSPSVEWKKYQTEKYLDEIHSSNNIGIVCGKISDGLFVIDIDCTDQELVEKILPNAYDVTQIVKTGKGFHIYGKTQQSLKTLRLDGPLGHIDIQSEGTYVVGPSSLHENGSSYEIISNTAEIATLELEIILTNIKDLGFQTTEYQSGFSEGSRNHNLFKQAIYLRNEHNLDYDSILSNLQSLNQKNTPPLSESEVIRTVDSAFKYSVKEEQKDHLELSDELIFDFRFKTLSDTKEILVYRNGVYEKGGDNVIFEEAYKRVSGCTINKKREILSAIQAQTLVDRTQFDNIPGLLCLENCILDIKTGHIQEHSPNHLFRIKLPVYYDPQARCPKFLKFLNECHTSPEDKITLIEGMANILLGNSLNLEKVIMHVGNGQNGKSTLLKLISGIIGIENTSSVSIHDLIDRRFTPAQLDGKMANIYADITDKEINNLGVLKLLVSGDSITVEHKNQPQFTMHSFAKHHFSCNKMPDIRDDTDATYRRFIVISWDKKFEGHNVNRNLLDELQEEKSGIFNLMIQNAMTLFRNKSFRYEQSIFDVSKEMKSQANRERQFLLDNIEKNDSKFVSKSELFSEYVSWCKNSGIKSVSSIKFNSEVSKQFGIDDQRRKVSGQNIRVWGGISLKEPENQTFQTFSTK
jgi:putative DNA primase/helicase